METKKHSVDHASIEKSKDGPQCKHFSIRGYVAGMRQKDLKLCTLFPIIGSEAQPSLPPLVVPRFASWSCDMCRGEKNILDVIDISNEGECNDEIHMHDNISRKEIVTDEVVIELTSKSDDNETDHRPTNNDAEVTSDRITDHDPGLENNLNWEVSNAQSLEVCPSLIQEMQANERGSEGNVGSDVELVTSNLNTKVKSCSKAPNEGKHIYEENQCLEELRTSCKLTREADKVTEKDNMPKHTTEHFPQEAVIADNDHVRDTNNNDENDVQDHHPKKYTHKPSKKHKKMRLLEEILRKNNERTNTERITRERSSPLNPFNKLVDSLTQTTIMEKVVGEAHKKLTKKGPRGRKRKLPPDAEEIGDNAERKWNMLQENEGPDKRKLVEHSLALRESNDISDMLVYNASPLALVAPNEEGLAERVHVSSNSFPQPASQLTLQLTIQEGTSDYQLILQGGGIDSFGEQRFPSTCAISNKGKGLLIEEIDEATNEDTGTEGVEFGSINRGIALTVDNDESNEDSLKEILESMLSLKIPLEFADAEPLKKPTKERDFDLNIPYSDQTMDQETLNGSIDLGTSNKTNEKTPIDLNSIITEGNDPTHKRILNPGEGSTELNIDNSSKGLLSHKSHGPIIFGTALINPRETPLPQNNTSERYCGMNRNPAEFTPIEPGNPYMMGKEDKLQRRVCKERRGSSSKQKGKSKKH